MKIKADKIGELEKFGFEKRGKEYVLLPTGFITSVNFFVNCDTREVWCGFVNTTAKNKAEELIKADMVEE